MLVSCKKWLASKLNTAPQKVKKFPFTANRNLHVSFQDPTASSDTRPRVFFYNYKIIGSNLTIQDNVNSTKMFVTRPEVSEIFFDVKLCTDCGCGESISKIFQLKRKPPLPGSNQGIKGSYF